MQKRAHVASRSIPCDEHLTTSYELASMTKRSSSDMPSADADATAASEHAPLLHSSPRSAAASRRPSDDRGPGQAVPSIVTSHEDDHYDARSLSLRDESRDGSDDEDDHGYPRSPGSAAVNPLPSSPIEKCLSALLLIVCVCSM